MELYMYVYTDNYTHSEKIDNIYYLNILYTLNNNVLIITKNKIPWTCPKCPDSSKTLQCFIKMCIQRR